MKSLKQVLKSNVSTQDSSVLLLCETVNKQPIPSTRDNKRKISSGDWSQLLNIGVGVGIWRCQRLGSSGGWDGRITTREGEGSVHSADRQRFTGYWILDTGLIIKPKVLDTGY